MSLQEIVLLVVASGCSWNGESTDRLLNTKSPKKSAFAKTPIASPENAMIVREMDDILTAVNNKQRHAEAYLSLERNYGRWQQLSSDLKSYLFTGSAGQSRAASICICPRQMSGRLSSGASSVQSVYSFNYRSDYCYSHSNQNTNSVPPPGR